MIDILALGVLVFIAGMSYQSWRQQLETNRLLHEVLYDLTSRTNRELGR